MAAGRVITVAPRARLGRTAAVVWVAVLFPLAGRSADAAPAAPPGRSADAAPAAPPGRSADAAALPARAAVGIHALGPTDLIIGTPASYRVALHWATGPDTSGPLPFTRVTLSIKSSKERGKGRERLLAAARSDASGHLDLPFVVPELPPAPYTLVLVARAPLGTGREQLPVLLVAGGKILLTTDKPLYQPSQTIHARALAAQSIDAVPLRRRGLTFTLRDPRGNLLFEERRRTSAYGVASADFALADEISLGEYTIKVTLDGDSTASGERSVQVRRYLLPAFQVRVHTERHGYRPGERLRGTVSVRYHHGKPVRAARVSLEVKSEQCSKTSSAWRCITLDDRLVERTGADGDAAFSLHLPRCRSLALCADGRVRVTATVVDQAGHRVRRELELPLSHLRLRVALAVPGKELVPSLKSALHVLVGKLDGRPARRARVEVRAAGQVLTARTDELGIATVELIPRPDPQCDSRRRAMLVLVEAEDTLGNARELRQCVPLSDQGLVVRPSRSLVGADEPLEVEMLAPGAPDGEIAHLDLLKEDQTVAALAGRFRSGVARIVVRPERRLEGLVALRGYRLLGETGLATALRAVYLEPRAPLTIEARLDRASYRPGAQAVLDLHVRDSLTGKGVQAALGLHAVDAALLELVRDQLEDPTLFFSMARFIEEQTGKLWLQGRTLTGWLGGSPGALRRRAAEVLLSVVVPPYRGMSQSDPWSSRRHRWDEQAPRLIEAAKKGVADLVLGVRTDAGWRFHPRLVELLVRAGRVSTRDRRDPWEQEITPEGLQALDQNLDFVQLARAAEDDKLDRLYSSIWRHRRALGLPLRRAPARAARASSTSCPTTSSPACGASARSRPRRFAIRGASRTGCGP